MTTRAQAILIGGAFVGVLSALPIISVANVCCTWLIGGGVVAAYLLQQGQRDPISPSDGAGVGCLAGVVGAFVYAAVSVPIQLVLAPMQERVADLFSTNADVPPEVFEVLDQLSQSGTAVFLFGFVVMLVLGVVFSTLGGAIGAVFVRRNRATPPPDTPVATG
jgi:hypothetical protein